MVRVTRAKAIRLKCLDCCCGQQNEVRLCPCTDCPLYTYRLGYEVDEQGNRITRHPGNSNSSVDCDSEDEEDYENNEEPP